MVAAMERRIRERVVDACVPQAIGVRIRGVLCGQVDTVVRADRDLGVPGAEGRAGEHGGGGGCREGEDGGEELHADVSLGQDVGEDQR